MVSCIYASGIVHSLLWIFIVYRIAVGDPEDNIIWNQAIIAQNYVFWLWQNEYCFSVEKIVLSYIAYIVVVKWYIDRIVMDAAWKVQYGIVQVEIYSWVPQMDIFLTYQDVVLSPEIDLWVCKLWKFALKFIVFKLKEFIRICNLQVFHLNLIYFQKLFKFNLYGLLLNGNASGCVDALYNFLIRENVFLSGD